ncbi:MAG TPA: hypothetical protein VG963_24715 [Polyangiaceae bacterium]|nr:hypothetical protein [Polyangiaceae bacterium]
MLRQHTRNVAGHGVRPAGAHGLPHLRKLLLGQCDCDFGSRHTQIIPSFDNTGKVRGLGEARVAT